MENETDEQVFKRMQSVNGKKGGDATKKLYGSNHFSSIGKKGAKTRKKSK